MSDIVGIRNFIEQTLGYGCFGSPEHTFCDVERTVQMRLAASGLLPVYRAARVSEIKAAELAILRRMKAKYEPEGTNVAPSPSRRLQQADLF